MYLSFAFLTVYSKKERMSRPVSYTPKFFSWRLSSGKRSRRQMLQFLDLLLAKTSHTRRFSIFIFVDFDLYSVFAQSSAPTVTSSGFLYFCIFTLNSVPERVWFFNFWVCVFAWIFIWVPFWIFVYIYMCVSMWLESYSSATSDSDGIIFVCIWFFGFVFVPLCLYLYLYSVFARACRTAVSGYPWQVGGESTDSYKLTRIQGTGFLTLKPTSKVKCNFFSWPGSRRPLAGWA